MKKTTDLATPEVSLIHDAVELVTNYPKVALTVDCVIFGFEDNKLKVLLIRSDLEVYKGKWSLLGDIVRATEELDDAAYRVLTERTGMTNVYLDQVRSFSSPDRHPGGRVVTIAYCSLLNIRHHELQTTDNELHWHSLESIMEKDMAFDHKEIIYQLGKHHSGGPPSIESLPFNVVQTEQFDFYIPDWAQSYKEIQIIKTIDLGSHMLLWGEVVNEKEITPPTKNLFHIHFLESIYLNKNGINYQAV